MKNTTLCYIEKDNKYLMLLRNKKKIDINKDKWIGVGGKFEADESPEECLLREVKEETGLTLTEYKMRGIITFISDEWETEYMYLYTAGKFEGNIMECDEGELKWIPKDELFDLNLWEGDKVFLKMLIENSPFFSMKLVYTGNTLKDIQTKIYE
ncbi:MAG: 8-oxo-dGTP diphosphatase [Lachnospiraceae bacterium]|nr:8-oxo-dGTP diphosphatase [Lachnospiraceae bacterium]MBQ5851999.1 8-oxo-dGTP diphosphatase [Lachnospiraceae bacterium]